MRGFRRVGARDRDEILLGMLELLRIVFPAVAPEISEIGRGERI